MAEYRRFEVRQVDEATVFELTEPRLLRQDLLDELRDEMLQFVEAAQPDRLVVDFTRVEYCTSAAISGLLSVKRRLAVYGGDVKLCGLSELVSESFERLGLTGKVFGVYATIQAAADSFEA